MDEHDVAIARRAGYVAWERAVNAHNAGILRVPHRLQPAWGSLVEGVWPPPGEPISAADEELITDVANDAQKTSKVMRTAEAAYEALLTRERAMADERSRRGKIEDAKRVAEAAEERAAHARALAAGMADPRDVEALSARVDRLTTHANNAFLLAAKASGVGRVTYDDKGRITSTTPRETSGGRR